jgi:hypothetical protein
MTRKYNLNDAYNNFYTGDVEYETFKAVLKDYYKAITDAVVEGSTVKLPGHIGKLTSKTIKRNFNKKRINYPASLKYRQQLISEGKTPREKGSEEGEDWLIYYTDSSYKRIFWDRRGAVNFKNFIFYGLKPAWSFKRAFSKSLKENELNEL